MLLARDCWRASAAIARKNRTMVDAGNRDGDDESSYKKMLITKTKYEFSLFNMYVLQFLDDYTINADAVLLMYVQKLVSHRFSYLVPLCPNKLPLFHLHTNSLAPW